MDVFERFTVQEYMFRALAQLDGPAGRTPAFRRPQRALAAWIHRNGYKVGVPEFGDDIDPDNLDPDVGGKVDRETWASMVQTLEGCERDRPKRISGLEQRLIWLGKTLGLTEAELAILKVGVRTATNTTIWSLAEAISSEGTGSKEVNAISLAVLSGQRAATVNALLEPHRPLICLGLLVEDRGAYTPSEVVIGVASAKTKDEARLRQIVFGKARAPTLDWSDFDHLGDLTRIAEITLREALRTKQKGVNILLHGEPGTGKTEFAASLAKRIGVAAVFVGEEESDGREPGRQNRIAKFTLIQSLAGNSRSSLLVVDEADDIFVGVDSRNRASRAGSKVFMNRLVETTNTPTIWITNRPERMGDAIIRRMTLAIAFPKVGRRVRGRIVEQIARRRRITLPPAAITRIANIDAAPAVIDTMIRVMKLTKEPVSTGVTVVEGITQLLEGRPSPPDLPSAFPFDPDMSAADQNLKAVADAVVTRGDLAVSFCLYGLPGTGKSAFGRYLADRLGLEVLHKRASDLLSMWVGGSEENIAEAFREARDKKAVLILDEADSLLRDRTGARQSWEVTQVNEMLTWMESHPLPFVCTTNLMDTLDPASLRRFVFKVKFLEMSVSQAREAFRRAFALEPPAALDELPLLTPGDFAVVVRQARIMGVRDPGRLTEMLAEEVAAKPEAKRPGPIGF